MQAVETFRPPLSRSLGGFPNSPFPSTLHAWDHNTLAFSSDGTHYGFVGTGTAEIVIEESKYTLQQGMYFAIPGAATIQGDGVGFVATRNRFQGLFQIGGPIESIGRLRYIDGCSDTLLIGPPIIGDPCLNLLHIPPGTNQTPHTHPSERLGMIARGHGVCRCPEGDLPLAPGVVFAIAAEGLHSFNTTDDELLVVAWHPDSDSGPSHEDHPMINRTIIDGVSAAKLAKEAMQ